MERDLDLLVVKQIQQANVLYRNDGDGTFTDITVAAGVAADGADVVARLRAIRVRFHPPPTLYRRAV